MLWKTFGRVTVAGLALGALCGVLYILLLSIVGFAQHPDPSAIPAALVLAYIAGWWGGLSGVPLGILNGLLVVVVALLVRSFTRDHLREKERRLLISVGIVAVAVNTLAVRVVVGFWLIGTTTTPFTFYQFPFVFAFVSAVLTDLWAARYLYRGWWRATT